MQKNQTVIKVQSYDDLRDKISQSGLFELLDCDVEIWTPLDSDVKEIQRMVTLIESMINVTDIRISAKADETAPDYRVVVTETSPPSSRIKKERR